MASSCHSSHHPLHQQLSQEIWGSKITDFSWFLDRIHDFILNRVWGIFCVFILLFFAQHPWIVGWSNIGPILGAHFIAILWHAIICSYIAHQYMACHNWCKIVSQIMVPFWAHFGTPEIMQNHWFWYFYVGIKIVYDLTRETISSTECSGKHKYGPYFGPYFGQISCVTWYPL